MLCTPEHKKNAQREANDADEQLFVNQIGERYCLSWTVCSQVRENFSYEILFWKNIVF